MLKITTVRSDMQDLPFTREGDAKEAINVILNCYLGWGGGVIDITQEKVIVTAPIMNHIDQCTVEGSKEEMKDVCYLAIMWINFRRFCDNEKEVEEAIAHPILKDATPLILTMASGMVIGSGRLTKFKEYIERQQQPQCLATCHS